MFEIPKYFSRKLIFVEAFKIAELEEISGGFLVTPEGGYVPVVLDSEYVAKFKPQVGGYIIYDDNCHSFSSYMPSEEFDKNYTRDDDDAVLTNKHLEPISTRHDAIFPDGPYYEIGQITFEFEQEAPDSPAVLPCNWAINGEPIPKILWPQTLGEFRTLRRKSQ